MEELIETLKSCGYDAFFVKTKEEALELSKTYRKIDNKCSETLI